MLKPLGVLNAKGVPTTSKTVSQRPPLNDDGALSHALPLVWSEAVKEFPKAVG